MRARNIVGRIAKAREKPRGAFIPGVIGEGKNEISPDRLDLEGAGDVEAGGVHGLQQPRTKTKAFAHAKPRSKAGEAPWANIAERTANKPRQPTPGDRLFVFFSPARRGCV